MASINCGNCGRKHGSVEEVRSCYGGQTVATLERPAPTNVWPPSQKQVDYAMLLQSERNLPDGYKVRTAEEMTNLDRAQVSDIIVLLKAMSRKEGSTQGTGDYTMPAGRYAIQDDDEVWNFYLIEKPDKGRWSGYTFIKRLIGSPGDYQKVAMQTDVRYKVLSIIEANQQQALKDFGLQSGTCGMCGSPLTDPESLARGIGPVCYGKTGW